MTPQNPRRPTESCRTIPILILLAIFFLIGAAIFKLDKGEVLLSMSKVEFARGLITYLFAVVTIGTAVVLAVRPE
jgi:hypothetical protein